MKNAPKLPKVKWRLLLVQCLVVLIGELLNTFAFRALIVPQRLLSGGVVGTSLLLNQLLGLPIGLQTLIYNIPIFFLGYRFLGRRFVVLSILGVASFSFMMDNLTFPVLTHDLLLAAVFGGVLTGIADGIIIRGGGSTGGFDILGLIVSRRFNISTGQVFLAFNGLIIALAAIFTNPELAMYTLISLFVSTRTINSILTTTPRPLALIISTKDKEIADRLINDLGRGVTYLEGGGIYTSTELRVLLCVITRFELRDLRRLVHEVDPNAFTVILDASDVIGNFDRQYPFKRLLGAN